MSCQEYRDEDRIVCSSQKQANEQKLKAQMRTLGLHKVKNMDLGIK